MSNISKAVRALTPAKALNLTILVVAVLMATYHLLVAFVIIQGSTPHLATHLTFVLMLGLLIKFRDDTKIRRYVALGCIPIAIVVMAYIFGNWERLEGSFAFITDLDLIIGIVLVAVVFITAWLWWGPAIPLMVALAIAYFLWGHLLAGHLYHPQFSLKYVVSGLGIALTEGVFSRLLALSANTIIYFMVFGAMMEAMGATPGFLEMGKWLGRKLRGGPAYMALVGSASVAMISGAGTGNVAITGTFTIPAMKSAGFPPSDAGAIECVCSSGGQITPPVMGASAFIMAAFIGVPYFVIMQKAIVGALLFYLVVFTGIFFYSYATKKERYVGPVSGNTMLRRLPIFIVGLVIVLAMLMKAFSVGYACSGAVVGVIVLGLLLVPEIRSYKSVLNGLVKGAQWGAQIGIVLSVIGILATTATATGLAPKGTYALLTLTGGALLPSLILIAILGIILGMGIPISAAYTILAIMLVPGLRTLGVDMFAAHFFVLYYAVWSILTPPYAPAAMVASRLSGGSFWRTGYTAMKWMAIPFILPFVIVMHPTLLNFPVSVGWEEGILIVLMVVAAIGIATVMFGWFISNVNIFTRLLAGVGSLGIIAFALEYGYLPLIVGLSSMAGLVLVQVVGFVNRRKSGFEGASREEEAAL